MEAAFSVHVETITLGRAASSNGKPETCGTVTKLSYSGDKTWWRRWEYDAVYAVQECKNPLINLRE